MCITEYTSIKYSYIYLKFDLIIFKVKSLNL